MKKTVLGIGLLFLVLIAATQLRGYLSFDYIHHNLDRFKEAQSTNPLLYALSFAAIYVVVTALSLPGAAVMTVLAGALFGVWQGTLIVSFASSLGATLAFLVSRYFLRDWVRNRFRESVQKMDANVQKQGAFYLFTLRLVPAFPFFLINLVMGLTALPVRTFYWVSQLGMLAGTFVYVNAGAQLSQLESLQGILSPSLIAAFTLLGVLPWLAKVVIAKIKSGQVYKPFQRPAKFDYNILVIGAGSAGLVTSYIAAAVKAKVALIEKNKMGGDCLNTGCVPSKTLLKSAKVIYQTKNSQRFGIRSENVTADFTEVMSRLHQVIKKIEPHDSVERYSNLGVECIQGQAEILSPFKVQVNGKTYTAKNIVIATGAEPTVPKFPGLDGITVRTSENLWQLKTLPEKFLVLGGGAIGCEMAQAFSRLGSEVTLVEKGLRLISREDPEASAELLRQFESENIEVLLGAEVKEFSGKQAVIATAQGLKTIPFDEVLMALGRKARTKGFGLENLGLENLPSGALEHDEFMATKYPNVFVCGDVAGPYQFTHVASHQAWYASVNALFAPFVRYKEDRRVIPRCTFTDPEVASVGVSEEELKTAETDYEVTTFPIDDLDRAICEGEDRGFIKVFTPKGKDTILGVAIVASHAGELLTEFVFAMRWKLGLQKILSTIHTYPTMSESNKALAGRWRQKNVSPRILAILSRFHNWRRS